MTLRPLLTDSVKTQLMQLLRESHHIVICAHRSPDGDAIGSSIAWADYLRTLGKEVSVIMPTPAPDFLRWMPSFSSILHYNERRKTCDALISAADLICCLDFNALSRLQEMEPALQAAKAKRLLIDHHLDPEEGIADVMISRPKASSTSELVFRLTYELGGFDAMTRSTAACIYCGMMTDTGAFTYASGNPEIYIIIAMLLTKRINKDKIYRNVYNTQSEERLRFTGYMLYERMKFYASHRASILYFTREDIKRFKYKRGDSEGLVNMPLQVRGMRLSISLREDTERDIIRVSLRSVDDFPCNKMAEEYFHGGGHLNAAGGELPFPMSEAIKTAEKAIEDYKALLWPEQQ